MLEVGTSSLDRYCSLGILFHPSILGRTQPAEMDYAHLYKFSKPSSFECGEGSLRTHDLKSDGSPD
jgi:hypothetical protein